MQTLTYITIVLLLVSSSIRVYGDTVPAVINTDTVFPAGSHTVLSNTLVPDGITLTFQGPSTVTFQQANGSIIVDGSLVADGTVFMGQTVNDRWGRLFMNPGSTAVLMNCELNYGGGDVFPPPDISNAMLFGHSAYVIVSNCVARDPRGDSFAFLGGSIVCVDNTIDTVGGAYIFHAILLSGGAETPLSWYSTRNTVTVIGTGLDGISVQGTFTQNISINAFNDQKMRFYTVNITNANLTLFPGTYAGFHDLHTELHLWNGSKLYVNGTSTTPVILSEYDLQPTMANRWYGIQLHNGSAGYITWASIERAKNITLNDSSLVLSNSYSTGPASHAITASNSTIYAWHSSFTETVDNTITLAAGTKAIFTACSFFNNNPPYSYALYQDSSCTTDARYCWWNAADGPYPFGDYYNERIATNGLLNVFPWLAAAPFSQTNPPDIQITSHAVDPVLVSAPSILLSGTVVDDGSIDRIEFRNLRSPVTGLASISDTTNWHANVWLFNGNNQIGLYAYDTEGNVTPVGIIVECTGSGVYSGGTDSPVIDPLPGIIHVREGAPCRFRAVAASPSEPANLFYWADHVPPAATFNQNTREFYWPAANSAWGNTQLLIYATDGTHMTMSAVDIFVDSTKQPFVYNFPFMNQTLPAAYINNTYFLKFVPANFSGPAGWWFDMNDTQPGLTFSTAGIISGVPFGSYSQTLPLELFYHDQTIEPLTRSMEYSFPVYKEDPPSDFRITTHYLPFTVSNAVYQAAVSATNGFPPYTFSDASAVLSTYGLTLSPEGNVSGTCSADSDIAWTCYAIDASNLSVYANLVIPSIAPEQQLRLNQGASKLKLKISWIPGKTAKGGFQLKIKTPAPPGFSFTNSSVAVCMLGITLADSGEFTATAYKPGKKLLYKHKEGKSLRKISVSLSSKGEIKASFLVNNEDLTRLFSQYGIVNEDLSDPKQVALPLWIRIGGYSTATEYVPVVVKSKLNKTSKGSAKW